MCDDLVALHIPALTPTALDALAQQARVIAAPVLQTLRTDEAEAAARRVSAETLLRELSVRHATVLAETDPAPPAPALPRPGRDPLRDLPLWRLVDVRDGIDAAPLEAALQAAGLLDAQVLADGSLLAADTLDTVLLPAGSLAGPTLADALRPDVPVGSPVSAPVVVGVLATIALLDRVDDAGGPPALGRDGSWRLGPLRGLRTSRSRSTSAVRPGSPSGPAGWRRWRPSRRRRRSSGSRLRGRDGSRRRADGAARLARPHALLRVAADRVGTARRAFGSPRPGAGRGDGEQRAPDRGHRRAGPGHRRPHEAVRRARPAGRPRCARGTWRHAQRARQTARGTACRGDRLLAAARRLEEDGEAAERDADEAKRADAEADTAERDARDAAQESQALLDTLGVEVRRMQADLDASQQAQRQARGERQRAEQQILELTGRRGEARSKVAAAPARRVRCPRAGHPRTRRHRRARRPAAEERTAAGA